VCCGGLLVVVFDPPFSKRWSWYVCCGGLLVVVFDPPFSKRWSWYVCCGGLLKIKKEKRDFLVSSSFKLKSVSCC
jgi:hypothetical protein